jgi:hypothetical protein
MGNPYCGVLCRFPPNHFRVKAGRHSDIAVVQSGWIVLNDYRVRTARQLRVIRQLRGRRNSDSATIIHSDSGLFPFTGSHAELAKHLA